MENNVWGNFVCVISDPFCPTEKTLLKTTKE